MSNPRIEIIVPLEQQAEKLNEALIIIAKMRHYGRIWEHHYGAINKKNLKFWQDKADDLLSKLNIVIHPENKEE